MGIFDLIQLLQTGPAYCQNMLVAFLYFWESITNTFQLPCGMLKPALFDVADITKIFPTCETFDPNESDEDTINFDNNRVRFSWYIEEYHITDDKEVFGEEHIDFLALWLSRCIFCYRSLKVTKRYITLSNQIHEGKDVCLSKLILGSLYESLGLGTEDLRNIQPKDGLLLFGPFWLLQLWLNATFEISLDDKLANGTEENLKDHHVKGTRLNLLTLTNKNRSNREAFTSWCLPSAIILMLPWHLFPKGPMGQNVSLENFQPLVKVRPWVFQEGDLLLKKILLIHKDSRVKWTPN